MKQFVCLQIPTYDDFKYKHKYTLGETPVFKKLDYVIEVQAQRCVNYFHNSLNTNKIKWRMSMDDLYILRHLPFSFSQFSVCNLLHCACRSFLFADLMWILCIWIIPLLTLRYFFADIMSFTLSVSFRKNQAKLEIIRNMHSKTQPIW